MMLGRQPERDLPMGAMTLIDLPVLALLAFAGYRGTQLVVHDSILDPARDKLTAWAMPDRTLIDPDGRLHIKVRALRRRNAGAIAKSIEQRLTEHHAVTSVAVDMPSGSVVVTTGDRSYESELLGIVEEVERAHGVHSNAIRVALAVTLISCVYCAGWWITGALLATWLLTTGAWHDAPLAVHGLEWLAVAGAAVLLNRWDDTRKEIDA